MRLGAFAKGQQLRLMAYKASTGRLASSATRTVRLSRTPQNRTQARGGALFRELEAQQEERSAAAVESKTPVVKELQWERPLHIVKYPDPRLRAVNARIGKFDAKLEQLGKEMLEVMYNGDDGVGLAAPQVGVNVRLMVYNPTGRRGSEEYILVNPKILHTSGKRDTAEEGCLSFPRLFADVERPQRVKVRAQSVKGETLMLNLTDWQARIFQHEYDHLQGTLFHDRMKPEEMQKIKRGLVDLEEAFLKENSGAQIQRV